MSLEQVNLVFQIAASIAVVASLIFVGMQIKANTLELQRNEHNSTMAQWTVARMAIAKHADIAELMTAGLTGDRALDRVGPDATRRLSKRHVRVNGRRAAL